MNRTLKIWSIWTIGCIVLLFSARTALSESWWESKQEKNPADHIESTPSADVAGKTASASRTNWVDGYIEVLAGATADMRDTVNLAHAFSVATKTARHLAYEKLAETVAGINLYSDTTYDRELMVDSNLKTVLQAMVRNARVVDERRSQFSDGSIWVEVTLGMKLFGENGLIASSVAWQQRQPIALAPAPKPQPVAPQPQKLQPAVSPAPLVDTVYTGLIIDASGMGAAPAMLPKILSEAGDTLYGTRKIDKDYILKFGLIGYQKSLSDARNLTDRVGNNPLVVRVKTVRGKSKADFVVSAEDSRRIKAAAEKNPFLNECRVVAVIN